MTGPAVQLHQYSAVEQVRMLRRGEITSARLQEHYLSRIGSADRRLAVFFAIHSAPVTPTAGALAGLPYALKDTIATSALPTTFGSLAYAGHRPDRDGPVAEGWSRAGGACIGKTATSEFGCLCYTEPDPGLAPIPRNPFAPNRGVGGSSGGSAAAVAAELVPLAHGTDSGGSIRIPAALNGVVGYKPSGDDITPLSWSSMSVDGVIARHVQDVLLAATALGITSTARVRRRWRIGIPSGEGLASVATEIRTALRHAADALDALGHELVDADTSTNTEVATAYFAAWAAQVATVPVPTAREDHLLSVTKLLRELGRTITTSELSDEYTTLTAARLRATQRPLDAELSPVTVRSSLSIGELQRGEPTSTLAAQAQFAPFTVRANVEGRPSIALPVSAGLPAQPESAPPAVMLTARRGDDCELLQLAAALEPMLGGFRRPPVEYSPFPATDGEPVVFTTTKRSVP